MSKNTRNYIGVYNNLFKSLTEQITTVDFDTRIITLINTISNKDIKELLEDILLNREQYISQILAPSSWMTLEETSFNVLSELPYTSIQKVTEQFELIHREALGNFYEDGNKERNKLVVAKIHGITAKTRIGLSRNHLEMLLKLPYSLSYKIEFADLLATLEDTVEIDFWNEDALQDSSFLFPGAINFLSKINPLSAISLLPKLQSCKISNQEQENTKFKQYLTSRLNSAYYFLTKRIVTQDDFRVVEDGLMEIVDHIANRSVFEVLYKAVLDPYFERKVNNRLPQFIAYMERRHDALGYAPIARFILEEAQSQADIYEMATSREGGHSDEVDFGGIKSQIKEIFPYDNRRAERNELFYEHAANLN